MRLFVLSDLHIEDERDPVYGALLKFLLQTPAPGDVVVLAGDVFDLFVWGKSVFMRRYRGFFDALAEAGRRGVRLHYIEGNHDFGMRSALDGVPGLELHPDEVALELDGKRFYVAHGDLVDRGDYGYLALRLFFRSPVMRLIVALVPGSWIDGFGRWSSRTSRGANPVLFSDLPPARIESIRRTFRDFSEARLGQGYDFVVLGHCHDLDEKRFDLGGRPGQYINMGFPKAHGSILSWRTGSPLIERHALN